MEGVQPEEEEGDGDGPGGVAGGEREFVNAVGHEHVTLVDLKKKVEARGWHFLSHNWKGDAGPGEEFFTFLLPMTPRNHFLSVVKNLYFSAKFGHIGKS